MHASQMAMAVLHRGGITHGWVGGRSLLVGQQCTALLLPPGLPLPPTDAEAEEAGYTVPDQVTAAGGHKGDLWRLGRLLLALMRRRQWCVGNAAADADSRSPRDARHPAQPDTPRSTSGRAAVGAAAQLVSAPPGHSAPQKLFLG
jgi:hypothetical protein